jgi:hypothetical protein
MSWPELDNPGELEIAFWAESNPVPVFRIRPTAILYPELGPDPNNQVACDFIVHLEELREIHDRGHKELQTTIFTHQQIRTDLFISDLHRLMEIFESGEYLRASDYELNIDLAKVHVQSRRTARPAASMDVTLFNLEWSSRTLEWPHDGSASPAAIARCIFNLDASRVSQTIAGWHALLRRLSSISD